MMGRSASLLGLLLLTGCTATGQKSQSQPSTPAPAPASVAPTVCEPAQVVFGKLTTTSVLTDVGPAVRITDAKGGPLDQPLEPVATRTAGVTAGPEVPAAVVYQALQDQKFADSALTDLGTVHSQDSGDKLTVLGAGTFVRYQYIKLIEGPFTYTCGGHKSTGTVTTWRNGSNSGTTECDGKPEHAPTAVTREVRKLRC